MYYDYKCNEKIARDVFETDFDFKEQKKCEDKTTLLDAITRNKSMFLCMHFDFGEDWLFKIRMFNENINYDEAKKHPDYEDD
jgi:hypothetical protein